MLEIKEDEKSEASDVVSDFGNISLEEIVTDIRNDHKISMEEYAEFKLRNFKRKRNIFNI